jgi:hypothetical protein
MIYNLINEKLKSFENYIYILLFIILIIAVLTIILSVGPGSNLYFSRNDFKRWQILQEKDGVSEKNVYYYLISQQAFKLTTGLNTDREKAMALATWIAANWRNASTDPIIHNSHKSKSNLAKFINPTGACGTRTKIFNDMAKAVGLKSQRYSIYNFGGVGRGHTATQVFYDNKWHFFDVTYSGYFEKSGKILSFDEIVNLGDDALNYLVAFDSFGDVYGRNLHSSQWKFVDNAKRMARIYNYKNLLKASSRGFVGKPIPVTLQFAMSPGDFLGSLDNSSRDVLEQGIKKQKSEQINLMGFSSVPFFQKITLENLELDKTYRYEFNIVRSKIKKKWNFNASSKNCKITKGNTFSYNSKNVSQWVIEINPLSKTCSINIDHNILIRNNILVIDRISFSEFEG